MAPTSALYAKFIQMAGGPDARFVIVPTASGNRDANGRWDDLIPVIKKYPDLLGIGLSEDTAIVVTGDKFEVMGAWKVAIHDNTRPISRGRSRTACCRRATSTT
jgi:cyanophycinase-like exopeptidase